MNKKLLRESVKKDLAQLSHEELREVYRNLKMKEHPFFLEIVDEDEMSEDELVEYYKKRYSGLWLRSKFEDNSVDEESRARAIEYVLQEKIRAKAEGRVPFERVGAVEYVER